MCQLRAGAVPGAGTLTQEVDQRRLRRLGEGSESLSSLNYFNHRKVTIFAGSNEIQKNIIAKHVLGL